MNVVTLFGEEPMQLNCRTCKRTKDIDAFWKRRETLRGRDLDCKECESIRRSTPEHKKYKATAQAQHRERKKAADIDAFRRKERDHNLRRYGINAKKYEELERAQNGKCAICGSLPTNGAGKRLNVDHSHSSKLIRGLLCHGCNTGLGAFKDNANTLLQAVDYLKRWT